MSKLTEHPIQRHIIGLATSIIAIVAVLIVIHSTLRAKTESIEHRLFNQMARQDIGVSIYQRLFAAKATVFKLSMLDNQLELDIVKRRFDDNINVIKNGLSVLQKGGVFKDVIATNIPGQNIMDLVATYEKTDTEEYALEVLELGPAIDNLEKESQLLYGLIQSKISSSGLQQHDIDAQIANLMKTINAILQRTQENAARILYESQERISTLTAQFKKAESLHDRFRLPVVIFALGFAAYLLFITLTRVGRVIANRKQAEDQLQLLLDTAAEGIYGIDTQGNTTFVNPAASRMLGYNPDELIDRENHELIHHTYSDGSHYPTAECQILKVLDGGKLETVQDEVFWRKDGTSFPVEYASNPIYREGKVVGAVVSFRDISARKHDEKRIRTLLQAVEQSPVSVVMTDTKGDIEYVNRAFEEATGYTAAEVIGKNPRILKSDNTPPSYFQELWQAIITGHSWQGVLQNRKKDGTLFWERAYIAPVLDDSGITTHYLAVKEDITLQKQQEEKIVHQANYDSLTDLPNRFLTLDRLSQLIKEARRKKNLAAVLFLDLDDFKKINDSMSHEAGDKLLIQAAKRLQASVRAEDTVSRLGGDEFIVLLGNLSAVEDVYPIAEKLLSSFREAFLLDGRELILTASIGIAIYPNDGDNPADLLRNADMAMYYSKEQGRNTYNYFTEAMNQGVSRRLQVEEQLHGALERGEFELHFQPIVDTISLDIVAVEALLRWNSSVLGKVCPDEFIPITEQTGQIVPIGHYVVREAISMAEKWQRIINRDFKIAINISPRQFRDPNLPHTIRDTLNELNISSASIELEVTEGVLMSGHTYIGETLQALSRLGISIAMDDFGTGYSSLSYLRSYPFNSLKIDRSFVNDITVDSADRELVNATIAMAHGLGLKVIAEGVETEEQLSHLAAQGCELAQGYLFSQPVSADEITLLLERQAQSQSNKQN
ncbi:MAG: EAL domain-containing protein [Candidatus Thiodiazotropha sp. (ex Monitilora ramsayi)]|nr:EAL domain-containing protein [Candidatus Thiodiazotropha sp. (ex Monitilora ramsayi)]